MIWFIAFRGDFSVSSSSNFSLNSASIPTRISFFTLTKPSEREQILASPAATAPALTHRLTLIVQPETVCCNLKCSPLDTNTHPPMRLPWVIAWLYLALAPRASGVGCHCIKRRALPMLCQCCASQATVKDTSNFHQWWSNLTITLTVLPYRAIRAHGIHPLVNMAMSLWISKNCMTTGDDYESDYRLSRLEGLADGLVTGDQLKSILCSQLPSFTTTSSATFRIYNQISDHFNTAPLKQYNTSTDDPISVEDNGNSLEPPLSRFPLYPIFTSFSRMITCNGITEQWVNTYFNGIQIRVHRTSPYLLAKSRM